MDPDIILLPLWYLFVILVSLVAAGLIFISFPRRKVESAVGSYNEKTLVIVPCRGEDYSLRENIRSILDQDYPAFDVIAVVDGEDDPSVRILEQESLEYMISGYECRECSGKTKALSTAISRKPDYSAYVICDSDITVERTWLSRIVAPLGDPEVGISTTFPYFHPVGGFWSKVKAVWGMVGQGLMESKLTRFGWGGSLAFRKDLLDRESFSEFTESVSDDTALSSICRRKGLSIHYSPDAQPVINSPDDFSTFFEWANRQTALSISATPSVFRYGLIVYVSTITVFLSAIVLSLFASPLFLLLFAPMCLNEYNNARRSHRMYPMLFLITIALPFLFLTNLIIANRMKSIQWRGREYTLQKNRL